MRLGELEQHTREAQTIDKTRSSTVVTVLVMACTLLSRLLGFVRIAVIGALFGASGTADVWNAVFTIPNNLRKLMAEGALSSAFIPSLSASLVEDDSGLEARLITRKVISLQLLILVPLVILCALFARQVVGILLAFPDAQKMQLSVSLFRWVFAYLFFISLSAVLMAVLNSHGIFVIPALAPILFSVCVISATLIFYRLLGIYSMVVGVLGGGIAQILCQLPRFLRMGYDFQPDFVFRHERFRGILKAWLPVLGSAAIFAVTQQIAVLFASGLEDGSTSALSYALVFFQLPFGIFSISIITVLFPRMSRQAARRDTEGLSESVSYGLRYLMLLLVPAALAYILMGEQIITVALQRRAFTAAGTLRTSRVLTGYSLGLFSLGGFTFLQRFFYSKHDFKKPLIGALVVSVSDILLSLWLKETRLRVTGLAVANSIAFTGGFILLLVWTRMTLGTLRRRAIFLTVGRMAASLLPFVAFILLYNRFSRQFWTPGSSLRNLFLLLAQVLAGAAILLGMYWLLGVEVVKDLRRRKGRS
ncbi:MAG: murein biosynthesis integral membrane protein MurJ [Spirochaetaceae bacterium]|nr:MAG: murein biosynthesis integral membrane protein MurJ [Spirochaetaceae bacterium]